MALDPRTKLYLVALANLLLFFHVDVVVESLTVLLLLLPLLGAGRWAAAVRSGCIYVLLLVGTWASTLDDGGSWLHMLGLLCVGIRMMMPCLIAGIYAFTTTTASQFVCALRRMRIPETIVIPCVVCIRFFPTIHDDYHQIRDAMALRGIAQGDIRPAPSSGSVFGIHPDAVADERCGGRPGFVRSRTDQRNRHSRASYMSYRNPHAWH